MPADFALELGGVQFFSFEIPSSIKAGGRQIQAIHQYPGGIRTIDTMGANDAPIKWGGTFRGPDAATRAQQIDTMRRQGLPISVTWANYSYLVIIDEFLFDFQRFYLIPYEICLTVVQDLLNQQPGASPDIETQIQSDISNVISDFGFLSSVL